MKKIERNASPTKRMVSRTLPPELMDDAQAAVLYSPFREKSVNPASWNRKMTFWEKYLLETALENGEVTFSVSAVPKQFERKGITPKGLSTVIEELERCGKICPLEEFDQDKSWMSWGFNTLVKQPLAWGVERLLGSPKKKSGVYVWPSVLQKMSSACLEQFQSQIGLGIVSNVMSLEEAQTICLSVLHSEQDFKVVMNQLEKERKIAVKKMEDGLVIVKCCGKNEQSVSPIKDTEVQVHRIVKTKRLLEKELSSISGKIDSCVDEARRHVRDGKKSMALHCLRHKKHAMKTWDKKSASVIMLEEILQKIEDATTNEMIVQACQAGSAALKTLNTEVSLEKVETTMDDLQEALENQDEINQTLSTSLPSTSDDDLEKELQDLLSQDGEDVKETSGLSVDSLLLDQLSLDDNELPAVPSHSPWKNRKEESVRMEKRKVSQNLTS